MWEQVLRRFELTAWTAVYSGGSSRSPRWWVRWRVGGKLELCQLDGNSARCCADMPCLVLLPPQSPSPNHSPIFSFADVQSRIAQMGLPGVLPHLLKFELTLCRGSKKPFLVGSPRRRTKNNARYIDPNPALTANSLPIEPNTSGSQAGHGLAGARALQTHLRSHGIY